MYGFDLGPPSEMPKLSSSLVHLLDRVLALARDQLVLRLRSHRTHDDDDRDDRTS